ncbi:3-hydroxyacyl-CoA dehydrogenase NAD-binding domain-containing protein [Pseudorhodoferax sp. Leaf274]|uniref:3-hydroxyacyl-CoA dehydrogenase NAD-binding domain-containing protein n=1 Tax=Pseudorhodoferax sp. Leaf274 TaxID=1736318 RepID=UPI000702CDC1|nr:3-hydroxyacyl-CoA dehydrogenase NAD-binding domain-containing protein [Pseudorhodoferax sp. Leaf274]KQP49176.1 3-hydroxybutyryl-CoA epimerase [Pseudorhodoferax sp. Leaf274]
MRKTTSHLPPAPTVFPEAAAFWEAATQGRLLVKRCEACGRNYYYPRPNCPFCGRGDTHWLPTSGRGTVYSFSIVRGAPRPTAMAVVELPEGPRLTTAIVDSDVHALQIGDAVQVRFDPSDGGPPLPVFTTTAAEQARAYARQALAASQEAHRPPDHTSAPLQAAAVVGAGTMGIGITLALLAAGLRVCLIDNSQDNLQRAVERVRSTLDEQRTKGRVTDAQCDAQMAALRTSREMQDIASADVVIEAVWEQLALKQQVFAQIDTHARPGALLGTNTSTLDIDRIAGATRRPEAVIGLHFFSPAHVMKLLEVVRGPRTDEASVASARELGRRLGKVAVVVGVCDGFVGNRLMMARERQAGRLLLEGASPQQVDRVLREFGLPMGTFELQDMAGGIELSYRRRQETGQQDWLMDRLYEAGRTGLRAGRGYYRYEAGQRTPLPDPEVLQLIVQAAARAGIARARMADADVCERLILPMVNEGAKLVAERIVPRASDIDVVWQHGYGWPAWKGGPMYYADRLGLGHVRDRLRTLHRQHGDAYRPADLIERLADAGGRLCETDGA